jgi:hypothetical protein
MLELSFQHRPGFVEGGRIFYGEADYLQNNLHRRHRV